MRKPVFPRILLIALLYIGVFVLLVSVQFAKRGGFTMKVGNFVVSGQYRQPSENDPPVAPNEYYLDGDAHVFFGGMDFGIMRGINGRTVEPRAAAIGSLYLVDYDGIKTEALPERMLISENAVQFIFYGGTELKFSTQYTGGSLEMRIVGVFQDDVSGIELPFKPQRRASIRDTGNSQFTVFADGTNYSFGLSPMDIERRMILIHAGGSQVSYRAVPDRKIFSPDDFILPQAETASAYNEFLTRWRDKNFSLWNRTVTELNNEDVVVAYEGEALVRGTYKAAIAAVPASFLRGTSRTHESSVYLGEMDQAYRLQNARDREKLSRLSRQINEKSLEFLVEPRVFEYFAARGHSNFIDAGADLVRTIDPSILSLDIAPGILEGYTDWKIIRPVMENPFELLVDQASFVISQSLSKIANTTDSVLGHLIFVSHGNQGDTEFNLRLGKALLVFAETVQNESWAGIGRSIILSALSIGDDAGPELSAKLYRILNPTDYHPRAAVITTPANVWTWTTARAVTAVQLSDTLNITVTFPAGET
ncbi:MAG: hypothetical protein LBH42_02165, partial [Treponema sp.]|nr:hypothetical protein [Treponema sp.]